VKNSDDWRLTDQEDFLKDVSLKHTIWKLKDAEWDHDHCEFCFAKFSEKKADLHQGYCTLDEYHWICDECFEDFKDMFEWKVDV